jgi:hypothetical protein
LNPEFALPESPLCLESDIARNIQRRLDLQRAATPPRKKHRECRESSGVKERLMSALHVHVRAQEVAEAMEV